MSICESSLIDPATKLPFENVAVFRALQLGDLLCATPALASLRASLPEARISLIGLPWAREFVRLVSPFVDDFIEFPGFPGIPERDVDVHLIPQFLSDVQARGFDLSIQLHGSGILTNTINSLFGARFSAGLYVPGVFCPDAHRFLPHEKVTHEIWRCLSVMYNLGCPRVNDKLQIFTQRRDEEDLVEVLQSQNSADLLRQKFVCLHPGARPAFRCWDIDRFAECGDRIAELGYRIVLTGSSGERSLVDELQRTMKARSLNLAGQTRLGTLAALLSRARLLICNDTGVSHLAVATNTPSVVVFTRSEFKGWPPLDRVRHRVVSRLNGVEAKDVIVEALDLLAGTAKEERRNASIEDTDLAYSRELSLLPESSSSRLLHPS